MHCAVDLSLDMHVVLSARFPALELSVGLYTTLNRINRLILKVNCIQLFIDMANFPYAG